MPFVRRIRAGLSALTERSATLPNTVLIIGPALVPTATQAAEEAGLRLVASGPYPSADALIDLVRREKPAGMIVRMGHVGRDVIEVADDLRIIAKHGVGVDTIDLAAASEKGIPVTVAAGANAQSVAEHAVALMFGLARSTAYLDRRVKDGHWDKSQAVGVELGGRTLGLVGFGAIARILAGLVQPLRMRTLVFDPFVTGDLGVPGAEKVGELDMLLRRSDVVSLHCPLTEQNHGLIGRRELELMKRDAFMVNTARGGLVDADALAEALRNGAIAGAALDTFPQEPPSPEHPLFSAPNLLVTPHVGANTVEAKERVGLLVVQQVADVLAGRVLEPRMIANKPIVQAA